MKTTIQKLSKPFFDTGKALANGATAQGRTVASTGARWLIAGEKPVKIIADKALKLNKISHLTLAGLVETQAASLEGTLEGAATRLKTAADAKSLNELFDDQVALIPTTRKRLSGDFKKAIDVLAQTRDGLMGLVDETLTEFGEISEDATDKARAVVRKADEKVQAAAA